MDDKLKNSISLTIQKIKENLSEKILPFEQKIEYKNKNIVLSVKDIDNELSLILSVASKDNDITFSNFIFDGSKHDLLAYLSTSEALEKTSAYAESLLSKSIK